jgi:hypothetical protein
MSSNVYALWENTFPIQAIREGGYGEANFNINTVPLNYLPDEEWLPELKSSKRVIYRTDTGEELGVHGHNYQPVPPKKMIDACRNILERSSLNLEGIQERIRTSHNGSRTFVQYTLPSHSYTTPDGDTASLGLLAISSIDGTWPFIISAAAIQSACTNLQVFVGGEVAVYKAKHTRSLDIDVGSRVITKALDVFENQQDIWAEWSATDCDNKLAFLKAVDALNVTSASDIIRDTISSWTPEQVLAEMPRQNKDLIYIYDVWLKKYKPRLGANMWAFYNAMTDWSTHAQPTKKSSIANIASVQHQRQRLIQDYYNKRAA